MIFFTSDTHFFHKNIIKYSNRPFTSVEEMNEALIKNWNKTVSPNDTIYHLGDFGFSNIQNLKEIINKLNGNKILILGNHDKNLNSLIGKDKFNQIFQYHEIVINGQTIVLNHYSQRTWNKAFHGSWHLFGHSHGNLPPLNKSVDVGVDSPYITGKPEYRPFSFQEISDFMNREIV